MVMVEAVLADISTSQVKGTARNGINGYFHIPDVKICNKCKRPFCVTAVVLTVSSVCKSMSVFWVISFTGKRYTCSVSVQRAFLSPVNGY